MARDPKESTNTQRTEPDARRDMPVSLEISDGRRIRVERMSAQPLKQSAPDETATWQLTIREFGTDRVLANWSVRREHVTTPMTQHWEDAVAESLHAAPHCPPLGASRHAVLVTRGHGEGWHVPAERPLGSSEWLALRSAHPETEAHFGPETSHRRIEHLGASDAWRRTMERHPIEDRFASERSGRCCGDSDREDVAKASEAP